MTSLPNTGQSFLCLFFFWLGAGVRRAELLALYELSDNFIIGSRVV